MAHKAWSCVSDEELREQGRVRLHSLLPASLWNVVLGTLEDELKGFHGPDAVCDVSAASRQVPLGLYRYSVPVILSQCHPAPTCLLWVVSPRSLESQGTGSRSGGHR